MPVSSLSNAKVRPNEAIYGNDIRQEVFLFIQSHHPDFSEKSVISIAELNQYRRRYLAQLIEEQKGDMEAIDQEIMDAIRNNSILSENIEEIIESKETFGNYLADKIAEFGGSWTFIIMFFVFLAAWMTTNVIMAAEAFDEYPFILLNLMLSCLAAIQAPIIIMSQNRQESKDRKRSENDYKINLKAELEIRLMNDKIDHLIRHQHKKLLEIQSLQSEFLADLVGNLNKSNKHSKVE